MIRKISPAKSLRGELSLTPDKSISQRAAIFSLLYDGESVIENYSLAQDPLSTLSCVEQLGATVNRKGQRVTIRGRGRDNIKTPASDLNCDNSGTAMRLLSGVITGAGISAKLLGDPSLSKRTMRRIIEPLEQMGAYILARNGEYAPLFINRNEPLKAIDYELPIPSAQLKSCILLAGLFGEEPTSVVEKVQSRDHTERLLNLKIQGKIPERKITASRADEIPPQNYSVPGDFSAAAFWLIAGAVHPNAEIVLRDVGLNPTRTALLDILLEMGANITIENRRIEGAEPAGDILVRSSELKPVKIDSALIPNCIDELPILSIAMLFAQGTSVITGAEELRHKETDRLKAVASLFKKVGANFEEKADGFIIHGSTGFSFKEAGFKSFNDHRIAMTAAVLALMGKKESSLSEAECAAVSYPGFWEDMEILNQ